ncbi:MAG: hypothetical protein OEO79_07710 [Gemmatimonadota bacterium]|nr:hypothetical protein [Gemmatimonadota bacterium]MDH3422577.1 hypothetical protein [Gemmatimonadota bacterium]
MHIRHILYFTATIAAAGCAGTPGPGDAGYAYNVDGLYRGRVMVEGTPFDASLDLRMARGGRVRGSFSVRAPLEIDGSVSGTVVDDLLRVTLTYESAARAGARGPCESRIEGLLTVAAGGGSIEGPVTVTDCGDPLPGRMSFRR